MSPHHTPSRRGYLSACGFTLLGPLAGCLSTDRSSEDVVSTEWRFEPDSSPEADGRSFPRIRSSPTVVDGLVFIGTGPFGAAVYGVDAETGTQEWEYGTEEAVSTSSTVVDGTLYVGGDGLHALDPTDGSERWTALDPGPIVGSPTVEDGVVYVPSYRSLYALDAVDGTIEWAFETGGFVRSSPVVVDGTVFVGSHDHHLYAVDAADGSERWAFETGDRIDHSAPTVADDTVFIGGLDRVLYALAFDTGEERWRVETGDRISSSPTVRDDTVFVGNGRQTHATDREAPLESRLYAVAADTGEERWSTDLASEIWSGPTAVGTEAIVVGTNDPSGFGTGWLYGLDFSDGEIDWQVEVDGWVESSPTVVDGTVFAGTYGGTLYAFDTDYTGSSDGTRVRQRALGHHDTPN